MAGYTRQSTADIIPTATVRAAPINAEYNALRDAFAASGGHKHDGTTGEGEYVPLIADLDALNKIVVDTTNNRFGVFVEVGATAVEQVRFQDGVIVPVTDNDIDLGTSSVEFKNLYLDGTAKIDTLTVDENATVAGTLGVTSNTTLGGTLGVTGATTLSSTLGVTGNTTLSGTLGVTGATTLSSTLAVTGSATLSSTLSVSSNATVGGTLAVTGTTSSTGDFSVNTNKFTVAAGTGNTAVAGTLGVTGATTVGGTLGVTGATTLSSTAAISGNTTIGGTLGVTGTTTYSTLTGANLTATGTVNFAGATVSNLGTVTTAAIGGGTINNTVIGGSTPAAITGTTVTATSFVGPVTGNITGDVTGDLTGDVTGDVTGNLTGNVTAATGTSTFNDVTISGNLNMDASSAATITNLTAPSSDLDAATKLYVDTSINDLIGGAPSTLDTLNEIAAAINDDDNVYTTLTNSIATKLPLAGGTMTGAINMGASKITNAADPTSAQDLATKNYIDTTFVDYSSAGDAANDAQKLAINAEDAQFTLSDGSTTGFSALHYAAKAATSYDSFDDRYLGSKASDPTLDNDGDALLTGALYFDSTNGVMKVYNGTEWVNASSSIEGIKSNFYYTATSGQTVFSGADDNANTLVVDQVDLVNVYMNGVRLHEDDYTVSAAGDSVTLTTGAATDDLIYLEVFGNFAGQSGAEVAITGGNIDGTTIGANSAAAITGTTITGTSFVSSGDMSFGDNDKAIFGAGSDLQVYHDTSASYISEQGVGPLNLLASQLNIYNATETSQLAQFNTTSSKLFHDNAEKLATTSTGIDVTGTVTADGLTVDGTAVIQTSTGTSLLTLKNTDASISGGEAISLDMIYGDTANSTSWRTLSRFAGGNLQFLSNIDNAGYVTRMTINENGDLSLYEDTGTTAKFFWDSSAESLTVDDKIFVEGGNPYIAINDTDVTDLNTMLRTQAGVGYINTINDAYDSVTNRFSIDHSTGDISFYEDTGSTAKFFWDASAEFLGIGTTSQTINGESLRLANGLFINTLGTEGVPSVALGDANSGLFAPSAGNIAITTQGAERLIVTSAGRVGIGVDSPDELLHISGGGAPAIRLQDTTNANTYAIIDTGNNGQLRLKADVGQAIADSFISFEVDTAESMRIDSDGNLLVGTTSTAISNEGAVIYPSGVMTITNDDGRPLRLNRKTSDGDILQFDKDGTTVGSIGTSGGDFYVGNGTKSLMWTGTSVFPRSGTGGLSDGTVDLGNGSNRFDDIYATNGTIQTSDRNEKQDIAELSDAEQRVAVAAKGLLRKFRWRDAVEEKGDEARTHFGIIAQDLQAAFAAEGLDAGDYAMFIHTTWTDEETGEERSRMGVRYSELLAFIIAAI